MNYQSPIELIQSQMRMAVDNEVLNAVQRIGVNVDKEELLKALAYDREQYVKGYNDRDHEIVRCKDCKHAGEDCEIAFHFGEKDDWFCADGKKKVGEGDENP